LVDPARLGAAGAISMRAIRASVTRLRRQPCLHAFGEHPGVRELPYEGGYRVATGCFTYEVHPDTGRGETAGDVLVPRVFGPGQSRARL
jgi:hypothetical protein